MRSAAMPIRRKKHTSREKPNLRPNQRRIMLRRFMPANRVGAMSSGPLAIVAGAFQTRKIPTRQVREARTGGYHGRSHSGARDVGSPEPRGDHTAAVSGLHEMEVRGVQMRLGEN